MTLDVRLLTVTLRRQGLLAQADAVELLIRNARTFDELQTLLRAHVAAHRQVAQVLHLEAEAIQTELTAAAAASRKEQRMDSDGSTAGQGIRGKLVN